MKRFQVIRKQSEALAANVTLYDLGSGVLVVDTFKDNAVVFIPDDEFVKKQQRGEVE